MKRLARIAHALVVAFALVVAGVSLAAAWTPLPAELAAGAATPRDSVRVLDRNGRVLREVRADDATRAVAATREELGDVAVRALVAAEDRRFYGHPGVDPIAIARSAALDVARGRIVSGASTLTMQLARLVRPHPRDLFGKIGEALLALRIEASLDKDRIVTEYANRAPFGAGVRGLRAASLHWFDKEPRDLSPGEAALLAALPRGPVAYDPRRHPERVAARKAVVLARMQAFGLISPHEARVASAEPTEPLVRARARVAVAAHFTTALLQGAVDGASPARAGGVVRSTLDAELQAEVESAVATQVRALASRHVTAAAALVVDHHTGEVLAYVGSPDPFDAAHAGFVDGVRARRQAGSTLKPFLYGLAFDRGEIEPATMLADVPLTVPLPGGAFVPANYDGQFHGPVRARVALASSLNVPAIALAERVGEGELLEVLHRAGFALPETPEHYGSALALGDGEVTLVELVGAYTALARGGDRVALRASGEAARAPAPAGERVLSARAAWLVGDILADPEARLPAFGERSVLELPFRASVKTGTSKGFRDNWAVGFTEHVTAGVWVGNFDGSSMQDVSGVTGAGPILRAVLLAAEGDRPHDASAAAPPAELDLVHASVCPLSGDAPTSACPHAVHEWIARETAESRKTCNMHVRSGRRVFEAMPPELLAWARAAHRPLAPETAERDGAPGAPDDMRIEHPAAGAHYYLEPTRAPRLQSIGVRVHAPRRASTITLRVDGREVARARVGEPLEWTPSPGRHALVAESAGAASEPVYVDVD